MPYIYLNGDFEDFNADTIEPIEVLSTFEPKELQKIAKKLDVDFTPGMTKPVLAQKIMCKVAKYPENILCLIPRTQFPILVKLFEAEPTQYLRCNRGKAQVIMQLGMVPALVTNGGWVWNLIMPTKVKDIIGKDLPFFQHLYQEKKRFPTADQYRQMRKELSENTSKDSNDVLG